MILPFTPISAGAPLKPVPSTQIVWTGDAWVVLFLAPSEGSCASIYGVRVGPDGTPLGPPVQLAGLPEVGFNSGSIAAVWTGAQLGVAWHAEFFSVGCESLSGATAVKFRRFHGDLTPAGVERQYPQIGCWDADHGFDHGYPYVAWNGQVFACLRTSYKDETRDVKLDLIDRRDFNALACGEIVNDLPAWSAGLASDGDLFGVLFRDDTLYFRRMADDGTPVDATPSVVTDVSSHKDSLSLTRASGEWAPLWEDGRDSQIGYTEVYMARLTDIGEKLDPPGDIRVTCCNTAYEGIDRSPARPAWTGTEYGVVYNERPSGLLEGDLFFQRVDAAGNNVGGPLRVTTGGRRSSNDPAVAWNGHEFGLAWRDNMTADPSVPYKLHFGRIGCNCTDNDGDHFTTCAGKDCNDGDPFVNPGAAESCANGLDDDCDAVIDRQDTGACPPGPGAAPGEVAGARFDNRSTLAWDPETTADFYDVLTGSVADLLADGSFSRSTCLAWRGAA